MRNIRIYFSFFLLLFLGKGEAHAQFGITHEIGILVGPTAFFTDYGERWNVRNNLENEGFGIGLVHYLNFMYSAKCDCYRIDSFFNNHFRIRNEIDYFQSKLEHFGPVASKNNEGGRQLRAMHGFTEMWEIGTHLEYHPLGIRDFAHFGHLFSPYVGLGIHYVNYNPDAYSDLGELEDPKILFPTFEDGIDLDPGSTFAIAGYMGARYKMARSHDILVEARWQYYNTDWLEGLDVQGPQNKFNDWIFWFNLGYVFYINF